MSPAPLVSDKRLIQAPEENVTDSVISRAGQHGLSPVTGKERPEVRGKFIFAGGKKLFVRGVTYGPFGPQADGSLYGDRATASRDFAQIASMGANAIRTYTVPPRWLLDVAHEHGLR
ncbi:MAG TPA: hypothetical protein VM099_16820, partial [Gemmatimonadaceae bacterium]|nr:hypothetical protein [Gemmatimonadaceae bacterium]